MQAFMLPVLCTTGMGPVGCIGPRPEPESWVRLTFKISQCFIPKMLLLRKLPMHIFKECIARVWFQNRNKCTYISFRQENLLSVNRRTDCTISPRLPSTTIIVRSCEGLFGARRPSACAKEECYDMRVQGGIKFPIAHW